MVITIPQQISPLMKIISVYLFHKHLMFVY